MQRLSDSAFTALLAQAGLSQAAFARLTGVTPRQVNKWCRGQATVPVWAGLIAALLQDHSADAMIITLEEAVMAFEEGQRSARERPCAQAPLPCPPYTGATRPPDTNHLRSWPEHLLTDVVRHKCPSSSSEATVSRPDPLNC